MGYAVTEVKGDELKAANTSSPVAALQGKVAGVEISGSDGGLFAKNNMEDLYALTNQIMGNKEYFKSTTVLGKPRNFTGTLRVKLSLVHL